MMDDKDNATAPVAADEPRVLTSPEVEQDADGDAVTETTDDAAADAALAPDDPGAGDAEKAADAPRFKGTAKKRIAELANRAREREQEAAYWRNIALQQQSPQREAPKFDPTPFIGPPPSAESFTSGEFDPAYIEERALYRLRAEQVQGQLAHRQQSAAAQETEMLSQGRQRIEAETARLPDLPDAVAYLGSALSAPIANIVADLITASEHGVDVAVSLASDDALLARIRTLPPHRAAIEIGKLEERVARNKLASKATRAPPPVPTVQGAAAPPRKDFMQMSDGEAAAWMQSVMSR